MISLSDEEWKLLSDLIDAHFGLVFTEGRRGLLEQRLHPRLERLHMSSFGEYYRYLVIHPDRRAELNELPRLITNNETYFFREMHQFEILSHHVAPELLTGRKGRPLSILSAGCSSGDEAYSIVITLQNAGFNGAGFTVDGCDLNAARVSQAQEAIFGETSLRGCDETMRRQYFEGRDGRFALRSRHRAGTRFFAANLMTPKLELPGAPYDVIFCRNVLIYFSDQAFDAVITQFHRSLADNGYLFLGHAESLIGKRDDFHAVRAGGSIVYRKGGKRS